MPTYTVYTGLQTMVWIKAGHFTVDNNNTDDVWRFIFLIWFSPVQVHLMFLFYLFVCVH